MEFILSTFPAVPSSPPAGEVDGRAQLQLIVMVAGVVMFGFFIMMSVRGRIARRKSETPSPGERIERIRQRAATRNDAFSLEANLLDSAQRLAGQLDLKAERLEQLLAEADQRLAELGGRLGSMRERDTDAAAGSTGGNGHSAREEDPAPVPDAPPDALAAAVYRLADGGRDPVDIARELDEQIGKVELILALRDRDAGA